MHWESSSRPLFVKTVWKDGQHHVVLQQDETRSQPEFTSRRKSACSSSDKSFTGKKVSDESCSTQRSVNFSVPSIKLLLAGIRNFKAAASAAAPKRCKTSASSANTTDKSAITIDICPRDPVKYKNLNNEVSFTKLDRSFKLASTKSYSVDVNDSKIPKTTLPDQQFNTNNLSERVLIWLDLATQKDPAVTSTKKVDQARKRIVTACPAVQTKIRVPASRAVAKPVQNYRFAREDFVEVKKIVTVEMANDSQQQQMGRKRERLKTAGFKMEEKQPKEPLLLSRMEYEDFEEKVLRNSDRFRDRASTAKRQLHIFMPNLPKKISECDSILSSSKNSSLPFGGSNHGSKS